jgi:hypothetical protein
MSIWTKAFWKATAERMVRAAAAGATGALTAGVTNLAEVPWRGVLVTAGVAAAFSLLASLTINQATGDGPALTHAEGVRDDDA